MGCCESSLAEEPRGAKEDKPVRKMAEGVPAQPVDIDETETRERNTNRRKSIQLAADEQQRRVLEEKEAITATETERQTNRRKSIVAMEAEQRVSPLVSLAPLVQARMHAAQLKTRHCLIIRCVVW